MIGGYVVDLQKIRNGYLWLATGPMEAGADGSILHVCVDPGGFEIREGDVVVWEDDLVRWTPRTSPDRSLKKPTFALRRVGTWNRSIIRQLKETQP